MQNDFSLVLDISNCRVNEFEDGEKRKGLLSNKTTPM